VFGMASVLFLWKLLCLGLPQLFFHGKYCVWDGLCSFSVESVVPMIASVVFFNGTYCVWDGLCFFRGLCCVWMACVVLSMEFIVFGMASVLFPWVLSCLG